MNKSDFKKIHRQSDFERIQFANTGKLRLNRNNQSQETRAAIRREKDRVNLRYDDEGDEFFK